MRYVWTFLAGMCFAGFVMLWSAPVAIVVAVLAGWGGHINLFHSFSGESVFGVRNDDGRLLARMVNVSFRTAMVPLDGDSRPRRILLRLEVIDTDVFDGAPGLGRVRLDAWPLEETRDVTRAPLYTVVAAGRKAEIDDDGTLTVDSGDNRRSVYALSSGDWLFDTDGPVTSFSVEGDRRRLLAAAAVGDEMPAGGVAVVTLASPQQVLGRILLSADDPTRARLLRSSVASSRPLVRGDGQSGRWVELTMAAGSIRVPVDGDRLDLSRAEFPAGLRLGVMSAWGGR